MMYNETLEDCFFNASHAGFQEEGARDARLLRYAPDGTDMRVQFAVWLESSHTKVKRIRFRVHGNPYIMAAVEWMCRQLEGKKLASASDHSLAFWQELLDIPRSQMAAALQIEEIWNLLLAGGKEN